MTSMTAWRCLPERRPMWVRSMIRRPISGPSPIRYSRMGSRHSRRRSPVGGVAFLTISTVQSFPASMGDDRVRRRQDGADAELAAQHGCERGAHDEPADEVLRDQTGPRAWQQRPGEDERVALPPGHLAM